MFKDKLSRDIHVGDIVKIEKDQTFPCDLIIIDSSLDKGIGWISTSSLDGEKNLKRKEAHTSTIGLVDRDSVRISGRMAFEQPNAKLYKLTAFLDF